MMAIGAHLNETDRDEMHARDVAGAVSSSTNDVQRAIMRTRSQSTITSQHALDHPTIVSLDHDTLRTIFTSLSAIDFQAALRTCKQWSALSTDAATWHARVLNEWSGLPTAGVNSWKDRYLSLWRAENNPPPVDTEDVDEFTVTKLNGAYDFVVHVKDASGKLIATGTAPVALTEVEAYAGEAMGGEGPNQDDGIRICAAFETAFDLPSGLSAEYDYIEPPLVMDLVRIDMHIHVARKCDGKVAHFLTCGLVQPAYLDSSGDGSWFGEIDAIGVGAVYNRWSKQARAPPSWLPLMKHALPEGPADGLMNGEIEVGADDPFNVDEQPKSIKSIKFTFGKSTCLGEGPWAPCFRTSLTLRDMPGILAALRWA